MFLNSRRYAAIISLAAASMLFLTRPFQAKADDDRQPSDNTGFVYVMTNQATGNTVLVFQRSADGSVTKVQEVSTGGNGSGGSGDPLGSQGSLNLSPDGRFLLAVNAGSNDVSSFAVTEAGLQFVSKVSSGGTRPVSVTANQDTAWVVNAGGVPSVSAFRIGYRGELYAIPNSTFSLPGGTGAGPGDIGVTPDGEVLVVTEKNTKQIDLFPIDDGPAATPSSVPSDGATPFGFTFSRNRVLIVSEAAASALSSYRIGDVENNPALTTITKSLPDGGAAACWAIRDYARGLVFAINAASNTISSYSVSHDGTLHLLASAAGTLPAGTTPIDPAVTRDGNFLYVVGTANASLNGFRVEMDGSLTPVATVTGLPASIQGIAAR